MGPVCYSSEKSRVAHRRLSRRRSAHRGNVSVRQCSRQTERACAHRGPIAPLPPYIPQYAQPSQFFTVAAEQLPRTTRFWIRLLRSHFLALLPFLFCSSYQRVCFTPVHFASSHSQMSFPLPRPTRTSACCTTARVASRCTASPPRRPR